MKTLIKNAQVVSCESVKCADVLIEGAEIRRIAPSIDVIADETIDASGKLLFPGFTDMHCHLRDPGQTQKEDMETGSASALAGGFTSIACMPNTTPPIDNVPLVRYVKLRSQEICNSDIYPIAAITVGQKGEHLTAFGSLKNAGAIALSDDGFPVSNGTVMRNALLYAKTFDMLVISHSEDKTLSGGVVNEGLSAAISGLSGIPQSAESAAIARDVLLCEETGARLHIAHVSTKRSVDIIREAKTRGVAVTAETCPHYISATDEEILSYNTNAKINPPLRSQEDVNAIIEGLRDGTIDVIATDHAPHTFDEKNVEFDLAPFGTVGFETAFAVAYTFLVDQNHFTASDVCRLMSYTPARLLRLRSGVIDEGERADLVLVDPYAKVTVDPSKFLSKSKNSLFKGWNLSAEINAVWKNGVKRFER